MRAEVHAQTEIDPSSAFARWLVRGSDRASPRGGSAEVDLLDRSSISMKLFDMMVVYSEAVQHVSVRTESDEV